MGANFTDYLREAHRCLGTDKRLHIWEPASYFEDPDAFCDDLRRLGFDVFRPQKQCLFLFIRADKNTSDPDPGLVLRFRGKGTDP